MNTRLVFRPILTLLTVILTIPLFSLSAHGISAQTLPDSEPGIVAAGLGRVTGPAATAEVQIIVSQDPYGMMGYVESVNVEASMAASPVAGWSEYPGAEYGPMGPPNLTETDLSGIIDVIVDSGIPREQIQLIVPAFSSMFTGPGGPGGAQLRFSVADPTLESVAALVNAVSEATITAGLAVQHVGVQYVGSDCIALEQEARVLAVADAQARAAGLATALGVTLGELTQAVDGLYYGASGMSECGPITPNDYGAYGPGMLPPFNPAAPAETVAYAYVTLTYAMVPPTNG